MIEEYPKMMYDEFVAKQRARGLDQRSLTLTVNNSKLVTTYDVANGTWGTAIEITPPAGQEISIRGKTQVRKDTESAHAIFFKLSGSGEGSEAGVTDEIGVDSEVEMRIERTSRDQIQGPADVYGVFNNSIEPQKYRPAEGIYLRGNDTLAIRVKPVGGTTGGDGDIDKDDIILGCQCDLWT